MTASGKKINVLVSLGKSKHPIIIPKLTGYRIEAARIAIEKLGLRLGNVGYKTKNNKEDFTVLNQEPSEFSKVESGARINLMLNRQDGTTDSSDSQKIEIVKFVVPPGTKPREVKMWLQDETGTREIYRNTHYATEEIDVTITGIGKMKVLIYLDDSFFSEQELN
jgi:beta-lactam-binding protein with PASTA domain